jgi:class 3 adenylate cyclase
MTYNAAKDRITVEPVGPLDLAGRADKVEVFRLRRTRV